MDENTDNMSIERNRLWNIIVEALYTTDIEKPGTTLNNLLEIERKLAKQENC